MSVLSIIRSLEEYLPILATLTGHPELAALAQKLIDIGEDEVNRRQGESGLTRTQELAAAANDYAAAKEENDKLKALGHENDT
jgi:hypothetical protein